MVLTCGKKNVWRVERRDHPVGIVGLLCGRRTGERRNYCEGEAARLRIFHGFATGRLLVGMKERKNSDALFGGVAELIELLQWSVEAAVHVCAKLRNTIVNIGIRIYWHKWRARAQTSSRSALSGL
jgi:hypothetical protein